MRKHEADDWTIERWRTEPPLIGLEFSDPVLESAPPLWKDLAVAFVIATILLAIAALALR